MLPPDEARRYLIILNLVEPVYKSEIIIYANWVEKQILICMTIFLFVINMSVASRARSVIYSEACHILTLTYVYYKVCAV